MANIDQDLNYREIICKAVCGKGRKFSQSTHTITPSHKPTSILGSWIINHTYKATRSADDSVTVEGRYDVNIWYSYNNNTKTEVCTETVGYKDEIILSTKMNMPRARNLRYLHAAFRPRTRSNAPFHRTAAVWSFSVNGNLCVM